MKYSENVLSELWTQRRAKNMYDFIFETVHLAARTTLEENIRRRRETIKYVIATETKKYRTRKPLNGGRICLERRTVKREATFSPVDAAIQRVLRAPHLSTLVTEWEQPIYLRKA